MLIRGAVLAVLKLPALTKVTMVGATLALAADAMKFNTPHDLWFYYVIFLAVSAVVGGMPEPDTNLTFGKFMYVWAYRSGHLLVGSATAYFMHQNKWRDISGPPGRNDVVSEV